MPFHTENLIILLTLNPILNKRKAVPMRSKSPCPQIHGQRQVGGDATFEGNKGISTVSPLALNKVSFLTPKNIIYGRQRASIIFLWCPGRYVMTPHLHICLEPLSCPVIPVRKILEIVCFLFVLQFQTKQHAIKPNLYWGDGIQIRNLPPKLATPNFKISNFSVISEKRW